MEDLRGPKSSYKKDPPIEAAPIETAKVCKGELGELRIASYQDVSSLMCLRMCASTLSTRHF